MKQKTMHTKGCPRCEEQKTKYKVGDKVMFNLVNEVEIVDITNDKYWTHEVRFNDGSTGLVSVLALSPIIKPPKSLNDLQVGDVIYNSAGEEKEIISIMKGYELKGHEGLHFLESHIKRNFTTSPPDKMVSLNAVLAKLEELGK